jgi:hypothetical protein
MHQVNFWPLPFHTPMCEAQLSDVRMMGTYFLLGTPHQTHYTLRMACKHLHQRAALVSYKHPFRIPYTNWMLITNQLTPWSSPSWEASTRPASQIPHFLWNANFHFRVHMGLPFVSNPTQIKSSHRITARPNLILSSLRYIGPPNKLFPSGFQTKIVYAFSSYPCRYVCRPSHAP